MSAKDAFGSINYESLYDLDMEKSLLNSIMANNDIYTKISDILNYKDFYHKGYGIIYQAMGDCIRQDTPIAVGFLKNKLGQKYDSTLIAEIMAASPIVDTEKYAQELKEKSIKRELIEVGQKIPNTVNQDISARDMVDNISQNLYSLVENTGQTAGLRVSKEIVTSLLEHIKTQSALDDSSLVGISSGFTELDNMTKGFKPGELIILAARPSMGKTTLCLNFILNALRNDSGVVMFSLEMPAEQIMMRIVSAITSIPLQNIITAKMDDAEISRLSDACSMMSEKSFFVYDSGYVNIQQVRTQMRKLKTKHPEIKLCVIDYIGLMTSTSNYSDRHLQIAEISRGLKLLARELDMPIIALSQLNRSLESRANKRPMLSDLRESGAIEQDADLIFFVYRDEVYKEQEERERAKKAQMDGKEPKEYMIERGPKNPEEDAEIIIGKNRNGPIGTIEVIFQKEYTRFTNKSLVLHSSEFQG